MSINTNHQEDIPFTTPQNVLDPQQEVKLTIKSNLDGCDDEQEFFCTRCDQIRRSKLIYKYGVGTYLCCFLWCFLTFIGGIVPFVWNRCQDKTHQCSECNFYVGTKDFKPCGC